MPVYSASRQYMFFANPQTASKAVSQALITHLDGAPFPRKTRKAVAEGKVLERNYHGTYDDIVEAGLMTVEDLEKLFKFCAVRNPFDLMVSRYLKRQRTIVDDNKDTGMAWARGRSNVLTSMEKAKDLPFADWLQAELGSIAERGKTVKAPFKYLDHADHVMRFEALQEGFDEVLKRLGVTEPIEVAPRNVTGERVSEGGKKHFTEYYDDTSRQLIEKVYAPLLERFGYSFG